MSESQKKPYANPIESNNLRGSKDYRTYIQQDWIRRVLQDYELIRRLRDDTYFRRVWVENEVENKLRSEPDLGFSRDELYDMHHAFLEELDFKIVQRNGYKPSVFIVPKTFRGRSYSWYLGVPSQNLSTGLNRLVESAVDDVLRGYGKGSVLSGIFGTEWGRLFRKHVVRRMQEEFGR